MTFGGGGCSSALVLNRRRRYVSSCVRVLGAFFFLQFMA